MVILEKALGETLGACDLIKKMDSPDFNDLEISSIQINQDIIQTTDSKLLTEQLELIYKLIMDIQKISQN